MKRYDNIMQDNTVAPKTDNNIWLKDNKLYYYNNGQWTLIGGDISKEDISALEKKIEGKADLSAIPDVSSLFDGVDYEEGKIYFKHGDTKLMYLDATPFIKDGMVSEVTIEEKNIVITFNTDSGKEPISIPLSDIFNPDIYYTKEAIDEFLKAIGEEIAKNSQEIDDINSQINRTYGVIGDIVLHKDGKNIIIKADELENYSPEEYTAIGIIVIPKESNVYTDGSLGVVSLKYGSLTTPDEGGDGFEITYGMYGSNIFTDPYSTIEEALQDFDGIANCEVLYSYCTKQPNWKTDPTIENSHLQRYAPAACCCWRYHTEGTKQGDWYLPACGELSYLVDNYNTINNIIDKLNEWNPGVAILIDENAIIYETSTPMDSGFFNCAVRFYDKYYVKAYRNWTGFVRPFTKLILDIPEDKNYFDEVDKKANSSDVYTKQESDERYESKASANLLTKDTFSNNTTTGQGVSVDICTLEDVKIGDTYTIYCGEITSTDITALHIVCNGLNVGVLPVSGESISQSFMSRDTTEEAIVSIVGVSATGSTVKPSFKLTHVTLVKGNNALVWKEVLADRLKTPIKLWGQEFDGSKDVHGNLTVYGALQNVSSIQIGSYGAFIKDSGNTLLSYNSDGTLSTPKKFIAPNITDIENKFEGITKIANAEDTFCGVEIKDNGFSNPEVITPSYNYGNNGYFHITGSSTIRISSSMNGPVKSGIVISADTNYLATKGDLAAKADDSEVTKRISTYNGDVVATPEGGTVRIGYGDIVAEKQQSDISNNTLLLKVNPSGTIATKQDLSNLKSDILGDDLESTFDTLKAVQDWADEHGTEYAELVEEVNKKANKENTISHIIVNGKHSLDPASNIVNLNFGSGFTSVGNSTNKVTVNLDEEHVATKEYVDQKIEEEMNGLKEHIDNSMTNLKEHIDAKYPLIWYGNLSEFNQISDRDPNTIYFITV